MALKSTALMLCSWALFAASAAGFTSDASSLARTFDRSSSLTNLPIIVTVRFTNSDSGPLRGFFYTEHIPSALSVSTLAVKVNNTKITDFLFESGTADSVHAGRTPRRWILETPTAFPQANPISGPGTVEITYKINSKSPGEFPFSEFNWAAYRPNDATASFGYSEGGDEQLVAFTNLLFTPLTVQIAGKGVVSPSYTGKLLQVGKTYKLTATPAVRHRFATWSGSLPSPLPALTFMMQSNLTLQANFVTNPFVGLKGSYRGLLTQPEGERIHDQTGSFSLSLAEAGNYSASFQLGAKRIPAAGSFNWLGQSLLRLKPSLTSTVMVALQLDVTNLSATISGVATNDLWQSSLLGHRTPVYPGTNASPWKGYYNLFIPGSDDAASSPGGDGYGRVSVSKSGKLTLAGKLADGTALSQSLQVSGDGLWPLYASLHSAKGSIMGWLNFADEDFSDVRGTLSWIKPALSTSRYYPLGFTNQPEATGARYFAPGTNRVLNFTEGLTAFTGGNLVEPITNNILLLANKKVINLSSNRLTLTITPTTGLFVGSVTDTNVGKAFSFSGALNQKLGAGYGFFLGTNRSGQVYFGPQP